MSLIPLLYRKIKAMLTVKYVDSFKIDWSTFKVGLKPGMSLRKFKLE